MEQTSASLQKLQSTRLNLNFLYDEVDTSDSSDSEFSVSVRLVNPNLMRRSMKSERTDSDILLSKPSNRANRRRKKDRKVNSDFKPVKTPELSLKISDVQSTSEMRRGCNSFSVGKQNLNGLVAKKSRGKPKAKSIKDDIALQLQLHKDLL